jgi:hypothetical protein
MKMGRTVLRTRRARIWPGHNRSEALARVSWPLSRCGAYPSYGGRIISATNTCASGEAHVGEDQR